jgi:hypothetical protein
MRDDEFTGVIGPTIAESTPSWAEVRSRATERPTWS